MFRKRLKTDFYIVDIMFLCWQWIDGILMNDSFLFLQLKLICLLFVQKYWVISSQHIDIDFRFSRRKILRVREWNLAWYMIYNVLVRLWSKIIEKWGTRCIFMLLNKTYILPPFWTRSVDVFKMVWKTTVSTSLR